MNVWTPDELRAFLDHVADDRLFAMWRVFAMTGMRRGEVLGLQWRHIDFERSRSRGAGARQRRLQGRRGTPKTGGGAVHPRGREDAGGAEGVARPAGQRAAGAGVRAVAGTYLFTDQAGEPLTRTGSPCSTCTRRRSARRRRADPRRRSRASASTISATPTRPDLLQNGIHPKVMRSASVSDVSTTLDIYAT